MFKCVFNNRRARPSRLSFCANDIFHVARVKISFSKHTSVALHRRSSGVSAMLIPAQRRPTVVWRGGGRQLPSADHGTSGVLIITHDGFGYCVIIIIIMLLDDSSSQSVARDGRVPQPIASSPAQNRPPRPLGPHHAAHLWSHGSVDRCGKHAFRFLAAEIMIEVR